jgi:tetratricopeptide (TPR) repeat protein
VNQPPPATETPSLDSPIPPGPTLPKPGEDEFPPNPLEVKLPDPLLPDRSGNRALTPSERQRLSAALDVLHTQASARLKAGDRVGAFEIWNRELRLRRVLGPFEEVKALARVGEIAWRETDTPQVRWISQRLDTLLALARSPQPSGSGNLINLGRGNVIDRTTLLEWLGQAYQQVRLPKTAASIYQQLLTEAKQQQNQQKIETALTSLGQLHLTWFDYSNAAAAYKELLAIARSRQDNLNEAAYLNQLAYIYEQGKFSEEAIVYLQQLVEFYQKQNDPKPIPGIKIRIGDNYQIASRLDLAEQNYQKAYELAQPLAQLAYASEALQKLAALYRTNDRLDAALRVYNFMVAVEQQAYNYYGIMNAYDQIGQIHALRKEYAQALTAFQQGLRVARQLKYREDYFIAQIQQVSQQAGR